MKESIIVFAFIAALVIAGIFMTFKKNVDTKLENFDELWGLGDPVVVEEKLRELLPQAESLKDKSLYIQILSQIALAQALQQKIDDAHKTLDEAEMLLTPEYELAKVRILLERGRVFQQAGKVPEALDFFKKSFELSEKNKFDYYTINAAHMIAIVVDKTEEKIKWNQLAIHMSEKTKDKKAALWLGPLYNNLGRNYHEEKQYKKALVAFKKALEYRRKEKYAPNIRVAKWSIGQILRLLNRLDEALKIQQALLKEYDAIEKTGNFDMPLEMFKLTRGWVYEELAEIYNDKSKLFAHLAYEDLSNNEMFRKVEPERLERLKEKDIQTIVEKLS